MAFGGRSQQKMSEETFDFVCTTCSEDNKTIEAVKYCVECSGYFCQPCTDAHKKFPLMKSHNVMDVTQSGQASNQQRSSVEFPTERCSVHKGKVLDMYCGDHDVVGCYVCIAKDHKSCDDSHIHSVPDMIDTLHKLSDCKQTHSLLKDKMVSMEAISKSKDKNIQALVRAKGVALDEINTCEKALEALLRKAAENSRNQVEATYKEIETEILNEKLTVDNIRDTLQTTDDKLEKSRGNRSQQFVCEKIAKEKIKEADSEKIKQDSLGNLADVPFSFIPNQSLVEDIKALHGIGKVQKHEKQKCDLYIVKGSTDLNIQLSDDTTECSAVGCCLTHDGHLVVTDFANKKLKLFDVQSMSIVDSCELDFEPLGVCCISNDEVAVACYGKKIQLVSTCNKMTPTGRINVSDLCYGIGFNDNKLYVTDGSNELHVYDITGTLLQTITQDNAGNKLFQRNRHVTLNEKENRIFVADVYKGVVCLDGMGNYLLTIQDADFNGVKGVSVDGRGNMFVAGYKSNNVLQFSENGKKLGAVVNEGHGLKWPRLVCFHQESSRMFVTMFNSNVLKIFQLS